MQIRSFQLADQQIFDIPPFPPTVKAWTMEDVQPIGFVAYGSLPGLPNQADLYLYVVPAYRRKEVGTRLFNFLIEKLKPSEIAQISTFYESSDSPLAHFLRRQGCYVEHEEWSLTRLGKPMPALPTIALTARSVPDGAQLLCELYNQSFSGEAWYQPYVSAQEIIDDFSADSEILFAYHNAQPIGFVGVDYYNNAAELEPLGIVKQFQGQGFGRKLLVAALHHLQKRLIHEVSITAWRSNTIAIGMYRSLGFQTTSTRTYLAYDIASPLFI